MAIINPEAFKTGELGPVWQRMYLLSGEATVDLVTERLGIQLGTDLVDDVMRETVAAGGKRLGLVDLSEQTKAALFDALADARANGWGIEKTARSIREYVGAGPYKNAGVNYRARMIARTETKFAQNVSSISAYRRSEVVTGLLAFDAQRGKTDADCEQRNGQTYGFDEAEELTSSEHPNGTLSWAPVTR